MQAEGRPCVKHRPTPCQLLWLQAEERLNASFGATTVASLTAAAWKERLEIMTYIVDQVGSSGSLQPVHCATYNVTPDAGSPAFHCTPTNLLHILPHFTNATQT